VREQPLFTAHLSNDLRMRAGSTSGRAPRWAAGPAKARSRAPSDARDAR